MTKVAYSCLSILLFFSISLFAGTTGKIVGHVSDSRSQEPLIGVNVFLEGTSLGAATDENGDYFIINVPAGSYKLNVSYIGYTDYLVSNVRVNIDLTTTINVALISKELTTETIIVSAKRPVVERDVSNSQAVITTKEMEAIPLSTVSGMVGTIAGVEAGTDGLVVRGGGINQTVFLVDGFSTNDERSHIPYNTLSIVSTEEVSLQSGGFNAEYGEARSGIIQVITKDGYKDHYTFSLLTEYRPAAAKNFGPSAYAEDSYFNRPFLDPAVAWTGTNNGNWDEYTRKQYPNFGGWNAIAEATLQDKDPTNDLTPLGAQQLFRWQRRRSGQIKKGDYLLDLGVGGPIPIISKPLGEARFYLSYVGNRDMFVFPLSRDSFSDNQTKLKITSDVSSTLKLNFSMMYGETESVSPYNWTTTPTGHVLKSDDEIANLLNSSSGNSMLYMPGYFSPATIYHSALGFKMTQTLNKKSFYDLYIQFKRSKYNTFQTVPRDTSLSNEPVPGYFVDAAPYGYWGYTSSAIDGMSTGGWMNIGRDKSRIDTYSLRFDYTNYLNSANLLKTGVQLYVNNFDIKSFDVSPSNNFWNRAMQYNVSPFRLALYLQDKLEFQGFVANIGTRLDYSNSNNTYYALSSFDDFYSASGGKDLETKAPTRKTKADFYVSPRLGISHPISAKSKIFFNYGHYTTEPQSSLRFRIQRESSGLVTSIGNPNLQQEKTIAYELGFEQNIADTYLLRIGTYYKDVSKQAGWEYYENIDKSVQYNIASNNNYEDIRGFELTLTKKVSDWFNGFVNYTYDVRTSGYFGILKHFENPNEQRDYLRENPVQFKPHPRPFARLNLSFHMPQNFWSEGWKNQFFGKIHLSLLANWKAGSFSTFNPNSIPGVVDNVRWRDFSNIDLRIQKNLDFSFTHLQAYVQINNLLNSKFLNRAGFSDSFDYQNYLQSLNFSWEEGVEKGSDKIGDYRPVGVAYDPLEQNPNNDASIKSRNDQRKKNKSYIDMPNIKAFTFLHPRDITFGIRINF